MNKPLTTKRTLLFSFLAALSTILGCGNSDWGYVTGTVKVDGQPVGPGMLMFEPEDSSKITATSSIAHFGEDGKYELRSAGNKKGAPVGTYLVMFDGRTPEMINEESSTTNLKSPIPSKYANHRVSKVRAVVTPGSQVIDFDLDP